ncbi:MAG: hypothetical protein ACREBC_35375 [Pyrinomonadaceae bacterium]
MLVPPSAAGQVESKVICRESLSQAHRNELSEKLREITGWSDLRFDQKALHQGSEDPVDGSKSARELIAKIVSGANIVVLEDTSDRSDIVFSRVVPGRWRNDTGDGPPSFLVQIDFDDFSHVIGDAQTLKAFNVGWVVLHEFDHIVNESQDPTSLREAGECEDHVNRMRRERNLPERTDYYSTFLPLGEDSAFITKWVRLAFDQEHGRTGRKKRYWLIWDAKLVGGLNDQKQIASLR